MPGHAKQQEHDARMAGHEPPVVKREQAVKNWISCDYAGKQKIRAPSGPDILRQ